jgi:hypothetical protein
MKQCTCDSLDLFKGGCRCGSLEEVVVADGMLEKRLGTSAELWGAKECYLCLGTHSDNDPCGRVKPTTVHYMTKDEVIRAWLKDKNLRFVQVWLGLAFPSDVSMRDIHYADDKGESGCKGFLLKPDSNTNP